MDKNLHCFVFPFYIGCNPEKLPDSTVEPYNNYLFSQKNMQLNDLNFLKINEKDELTLIRSTIAPVLLCIQKQYDSGKLREIVKDAEGFACKNKFNTIYISPGRLFLPPEKHTKNIMDILYDKENNKHLTVDEVNNFPAGPIITAFGKIYMLKYQEVVTFGTLFDWLS